MFGALLLAVTCVCGLDHEIANERCETLWSGENVTSGAVSRVVSFDGFRQRALYIAGGPGFHAEVDETGDGVWRKAGIKKRYPGIYDLRYLNCAAFRIVADGDATNVTAVVDLCNPVVNREAPLVKGGPWSGTAVKAGEPSDPFPIHGFGSKYLSVSSDSDAKIDLELDITGTGTWIPFRTLKSAVRLNVSNVRAFRLRAVADRDCTATVQLEYR